MPKKSKIPPIRVGSKAVTLTESDGTVTYRCEILALYHNGAAVNEVDADTRRGVTADLRRPDGREVLGASMGTERGCWCRPYISSMTVRYGR